MSIDQAGLAELTQAAQDFHADAMRITPAAVAECVELGREPAGTNEAGVERRRVLARSLRAAGALSGGGLAAMLLRNAVTTVYADSTADVAMLQTAASIENLAVAVYKQALALPPAVSGTDNALIATFITTTIKQHGEHAQAFNTAALGLGGKAQTDVDHAVLTAVVTPALAKVKGPADVVALALTLEDSAAQTYIKFGGTAGDPAALKPFAAIAPVEAQHAAILRAVAALLAASAPQLVTLPPNLALLPAGVGDVAFRQAGFYPTGAARSATEGVVAAPSPSASASPAAGASASPSAG